jgi:hypothetical protein
VQVVAGVPDRALGVVGEGAAEVAGEPLQVGPRHILVHGLQPGGALLAQEALVGRRGAAEDQATAGGEGAAQQRVEGRSLGARHVLVQVEQQHRVVGAVVQGPGAEVGGDEAQAGAREEAAGDGGVARAQVGADHLGGRESLRQQVRRPADAAAEVEDAPGAGRDGGEGVGDRGIGARVAVDGVGQQAAGGVVVEGAGRVHGAHAGSSGPGSCRAPGIVARRAPPNGRIDAPERRCYAGRTGPGRAAPQPARCKPYLRHLRHLRMLLPE